MIVRAKLLGPKNERRVVGWDGFTKRRVREGDEFEIPEDMIEVTDKVTGIKSMKNRHFSERWMESVDQPVPIVKQSKPAQKQSRASDSDLI